MANEEKLISFCSALDKSFKNVIEFMHGSWFEENYYSVLKKYKVAICIVFAFGIPEIFVTTSKVAYIRYHGLGSNWYRYNYTEKELNSYAGNIKALNTKEIYIYFNNDYKVHAIKNALKLKEILEV